MKFLMAICAIFPIGLILGILTDPVGIISTVGILGVLCILFVFSIPFLICYCIYNSAKKEKIRNEKKMKKVGASNMVHCQHIAGIPIPEQAHCILYLCKDSLSVEYNNKLYKINIDTIVDAYVDNFVNISKHYVSSAGGAVAGGMLFGTVGAAVGGRIQTKYDVSSKQFIGITRREGGKYSCILLEVKIPNIASARELAKNINARLHNNIIEI